jgi:hypothetical protein
MGVKKKDPVLEELRGLRVLLGEIASRQEDMGVNVAYLMRMDVTIGGLDTKLRDVLSREATSSNLARDAYHKWLLSFDQAHREALIAAVRGELPTPPEGKT